MKNSKDGQQQFSAPEIAPNTAQDQRELFRNIQAARGPQGGPLRTESNRQDKHAQRAPEAHPPGEPESAGPGAGTSYDVVP